MSNPLLYKKAAQIFVCVKLGALLFGCKRDYPPTVAYSVSGVVHDPSGVPLKPFRFDISILDYEGTKLFNGGRYSFGAHLSMDAQGKFNGSFDGPDQHCKMGSSQFLIIKYDSTKKERLQLAVVDSISHVTCQEVTSGSKSVMFDLFTKNN